MSDHAEIKQEHWDFLDKMLILSRTAQQAQLLADYAAKVRLDERERNKALGLAVRELLELYPQSYRCDYGSREMTHIEVSDWKEIRAKLEAELERSAKP